LAAPEIVLGGEEPFAEHRLEDAQAVRLHEILVLRDEDRLNQIGIVHDEEAKPEEAEGDDRPMLTLATLEEAEDVASQVVQVAEEELPARASRCGLIQHRPTVLHVPAEGIHLTS